MLRDGYKRQILCYIYFSTIKISVKKAKCKNKEKRFDDHNFITLSMNITVKDEMRPRKYNEAMGMNNIRSLRPFSKGSVKGNQEAPVHRKEGRRPGRRQICRRNQLLQERPSRRARKERRAGGKSERGHDVSL